MTKLTSFFTALLHFMMQQKKGASRIFTREQIDELAPVDEQMSEREKKAMTEGVKIELEHESQISTPMEVDIDAP